MDHGCVMSTTIITPVCSMDAKLREKGSRWLCHTTPSRIHTLIRSRKSGSVEREKEGGGGEKGERKEMCEERGNMLKKEVVVHKGK